MLMYINSGSTHDARVWRSSRVKAEIEGMGEFTVAGDSPYPISKFVVKAYLNPSTDQKLRYNHAQCGLRSQCTECVFGVLKNRDDILRKSPSFSFSLPWLFGFQKPP